VGVKPNLKEITKYAMEQASLSESEKKKADDHLLQCICELCRKWNAYLRIKETIEMWERKKAEGKDAAHG
jgi:hypothetical protein